MNCQEIYASSMKNKHPRDMYIVRPDFTVMLLVTVALYLKKWSLNDSAKSKEVQSFPSQGIL